MLEKTKVVFLGSRPLGAFALKTLRAMDDIDVVAYVVRKPPSRAWWTDDPFDLVDSGFKKFNSHEELMGLDFDLGVSINYWKIMPPELIAPPRLGFINLHHAFNLSLRGRNMTAHAILNARRENSWFHGSCLHYTDDGLDTGPIIASSACEITEFDTGWSLFNKVEILGQSLIKEWFPRLLAAKIPAAFPQANHPMNKRITDDDEKFIQNIHADPLMTYDLVRAFDFNGHYRGMFTRVDGVEVDLTVEKDRGSRVLLKIDSQRKIYEVKR